MGASSIVHSAFSFSPSPFINSHKSKQFIRLQNSWRSSSNEDRINFIDQFAFFISLSMTKKVGFNFLFAWSLLIKCAKSHMWMNRKEHGYKSQVLWLCFWFPSCIILGYDQFLTIDKKKMNQAKFRLTILIAILGLGFLSSCRQPTFINLTSQNISQNPSGIYTLQTEVDIQDRRIAQNSYLVSCNCWRRKH